MLEHQVCAKSAGTAVRNNLLFAHAILGRDTTSRVFSMGKGLALKHIRSDNHFITQAEIFPQENATLADIPSAGEAALVCRYRVAVCDTLEKKDRLQRFHQKVHVLCSLKTFIRRHQLPSTIASVFTSRCKHGRGNQGLVHICIHRKVVRCNCKIGCDTLRSSCRKTGLDCSTGCGECRWMCANVYENITEDNEYEEDT